MRGMGVSNTVKGWSFGVGFYLGVFAWAGVEAREPTIWEQYMVELINRARLNPQAEVDRLSGENWIGSPDLNEGLAPGTISADPKQPLAINPSLVKAAADYADHLLRNNLFGHSHDGRPGDRAIRAGYGDRYTGENLHVTATSAPVFELDMQFVDSGHSALFVDDTVSGRTHRVNTLTERWTEVGVGMGTWHAYTLFGPVYRAALVCQEFGSHGGPFVTGVAYHDVDSNGFYSPDPMEPIAGLHVDLVDSATGLVLATAITFGSGGYGIEVPGPGTYDIRFYDDQGVIDETIASVSVGRENVKVDAVSPGYNPRERELQGAFEITEVKLVSEFQLEIAFNSAVGQTYQLSGSLDGGAGWEDLGPVILADSKLTRILLQLDRIDGVGLLRIRQL